MSAEFHISMAGLPAILRDLLAKLPLLGTQQQTPDVDVRRLLIHIYYYEYVYVLNNPYICLTGVFEAHEEYSTATTTYRRGSGRSGSPGRWRRCSSRCVCMCS